jgi:hypothetical protein
LLVDFFSGQNLKKCKNLLNIKTRGIEQNFLVKFLLHLFSFLPSFGFLYFPIFAIKLSHFLPSAYYSKTAKLNGEKNGNMSVLQRKNLIGLTPGPVTELG